VIDHLSVANALRLSVFALFAQVEVEVPSRHDYRYCPVLYCTGKKTPVLVQAAELPTEMAIVISSKFGNRLRIVSKFNTSTVEYGEPSI
jgi:hypothetical protein